MSEELTPAKWKQKIDRSLRLQKPRLEESDRFLRAYTGDYGVKPQKTIEDNKDEMAVNFVYSFVETIAPSIFGGTPTAFCEAYDPSAEPWVDHYQAVLNYWGRCLGLKRHFNRCRFDSFFGITGMLSEWDFEEAEVEEPNIISVNPMTGEPVLGPPKKTLKVIRDRPLVKRVASSDIILDPDSDFREEDRWRAMRIKMTKAEFDRLPGVGSDMKKAITGKSLSNDISNPYGQDRDRYTDNNWVVLFKIYDLETETIKLLPEGEAVKDFVEMKEWPYLFEVENDRFPLTVHDGKIDPRNPYTFSEFKAFWAQIQEQNKLRTMLQSHVRRNAPGWLIKKSSMDEAEKEKLVGSRIAEVIEVSKPELIMSKPMSVLAKEFFQHSGQSNDDLINTSGFYEYQHDSIADTATEASLLQGRSNIRKGDRKRTFGDFQATVFGKMGQLCQQYMDEPIAAKIKHPKNPQEMIWISANREQIIGEYGVNVKAGVDENEDEGLFRQQTLKFAEFMASNPHVDQRWLAKEMCKVFKRDPDKALKPIEQVQQEQQAAAEAAKPPHKPDVTFKPIDPAMLAQMDPQVLVPIIAAAMRQNGVSAPATGVPGVGLAPDSPPSTSMSGPVPDNSSVMPGAEMNQTNPALPGANMPPANPVMPMSEMQGGQT